jgi:hypothetical protein
MNMDGGVDPGDDCRRSLPQRAGSLSCSRRGICRPWRLSSLQQLVEQPRHRVSGFVEKFHRGEGAIKENFDQVAIRYSS